MKRSESKVLKSVSEIKTNQTKNTIIQYGLLAIAGVLACALAFKDTEVIATPPNFTQPLVVAGNVANKEYKLRWAVAAASIAGNLSKDNADFVLNQLDSMLSPYLRQQILPSLKKEVQILIARDAEQTFVIKDAIYDPVKDLVWIWGDRTIKLKATANNINLPQRWTYEFRVKPFSERAAITHFNSYKGLPKNRDVEYLVEENPMLTAELKKVISDD
ncbi:TraE/TraK family type IV conjugative transfer system protein [Pseudoalteromonas sp. APC 3358]|uniref:TraE/TraK family type IV conjugative transfer system protein n=1 Tax=Pseudoalteromonas sp. APC 3358 TaxID=3035176 RepID=UPI0025B5A496|nr:TraE/TraK family type IV conjugative transfer system protein [Pseudoalteromonas sp. APC 3358]MDN3384483.1 TraE/TraK family type IV conjugative transfer system protein [Pseudoalteromonas sp. APC 3358]